MFECVVVIITQKGDSHTTTIDLHCDETFNTGKVSESCLCNSIVMIVYTLRVKHEDIVYWNNYIMVNVYLGHKVTTVTKTNA